MNQSNDALSDDLDPEVQARLAEAEALLAALDTDLEALIGADLVQATAGLAALRAGGDVDEMLDQVYGAFHDIKGVGGSFGYELVTTVAANMCRFMKVNSGAGTVVLAAIDRHIAALEAIKRDNLTGDGGDEGMRLLAGLDPVD